MEIDIVQAPNQLTLAGKKKTVSYLGPFTLEIEGSRLVINKLCDRWMSWTRSKFTLH